MLRAINNQLKQNTNPTQVTSLQYFNIFSLHLTRFSNGILASILTSLFLANFSSLYAQNFMGRLPSSIILQDGQDQSHSLIPNCGNQYCYFGLPGPFNPYSYDFSYSTSSGSSKLTLSATNPTTANPPYNGLSIFYIGHLNVGANSYLNIREFHTLTIRNGLTLEENAILEINLKKGSLINSSEFGPKSQLVVARSGAFILARGSRFSLENADEFKLNTQAYISQDAEMNINVGTSSISYQLYNKGKIKITGDVKNIGVTPTALGLATSTITNEGILEINGNLQNGSTNNLNNGAGALINYGGVISITGKLINQSVISSAWGDAESSVQIYGGTLKVNGGIQNQAGSRLIIGVYKGDMGKIEGNVDNNGKIEIDFTGAKLGTHQFITGNLSGSGSVNASIGGSQSEFITQQIQGGSLTLSKNENAITSFLHNLESNQSGIISELDHVMQNNNNQSIYTYGNKTFLTQLGNDINTNIQSMLNASSLNLWSMLESTLSPIMYKPQDSRASFHFSPFLSNASYGSLHAPLYGFSANASRTLGMQELNAFFTYANSTMNNITNQSQVQLNTHAILIGLYNKITLSRTELALLAYYGNTSQKSTRTLSFNLNPSSAKISYHELRLRPTIGYIFASGQWYFKPFIGLDYNLGLQTQSKETGDASLPQISLDSQNSHTLELNLGIQTHYKLLSKYTLFGGMQISQALLFPTLYANYNTSKLSFKTTNSLGYNLHIGGSISIHKLISIGFYGLYAHSTRDFNTLSGVFNLSYQF